MKIKCAHCGKTADLSPSHVNRSHRDGLRLFCGRHCAGLGRRKHKSKAQRVTEKKLYDKEYRRKNRARIMARKADYHRRTYDPAKAAIVRKRRMPWRVEYCRRPEYKRWKQSYDRQYRAKKLFGPFAEAAMVMMDLTYELKGRIDSHEIKYQNGGTNKAQRRRREARQEKERGRNSRRRDNDPAAVGF